MVCFRYELCCAHLKVAYLLVVDCLAASPPKRLEKRSANSSAAPFASLRSTYFVPISLFLNVFLGWAA